MPIQLPRPCVLYLYCSVAVPQFETRRLRFMSAYVSVGPFANQRAADEWEAAFLQRAGDFNVDVKEESCFVYAPTVTTGICCDYHPEVSIDYIACDLYLRVPQNTLQCG